MTTQKLVDKIARLTKELEQERSSNATLRQQIETMEQQERNMAALFRGAQPTIEGRIAHAIATSSRKTETEKGE
ncbi:hypothetical protein KKB10_04475 [Patescibacteria group bacterium]|nr:hypothetical protein [Patescibacteria group bacterium]MBU1951330.1 hypothetical protein [Patescibacteria group bacterium]MBU2236302.1 hypothetical protein [Patescibacteria group bacterium]